MQKLIKIQFEAVYLINKQLWPHGLKHPRDIYHAMVSVYKCYSKIFDGWQMYIASKHVLAYCIAQSNSGIKFLDGQMQHNSRGLFSIFPF